MRLALDRSSKMHRMTIQPTSPATMTNPIIGMSKSPDVIHALPHLDLIIPQEGIMIITN